MYLYTDIDIFKTPFLFCFWDEEVIKKGLWEALEVLFGGHEDCRHTKTGHGSLRQARKTALKTTSLFDYWQLCNGNGLWNQWTCVTQREKLNLSGSSCLFSPFCLSLSFSSSASASALWWTLFPSFRTGWTEMLASFLPDSCRLRVSFPRACPWLTSERALQSNGGSPLSLLVT